MAPSDDLEQRRPPFFPVVIATVFLAIIGMSVGLVLGARAKEQARQPQGSSAVTVPTSAAPTSNGPACRPETQRMGVRAGAAGILRVALRIRTATSSVWICRDEASRFYYHANRGGEGALWVEGRTALFLPGVVADPEGYRAVSVEPNGRRTTFLINKERLLIVHKDGRRERQPAVG